MAASIVVVAIRETSVVRTSVLSVASASASLDVASTELVSRPGMTSRLTNGLSALAAPISRIRCIPAIAMRMSSG